jgi:hypothetical protein
MKKSFGLVAGSPNVAIIDTQGRLYTVESGQFDDRRIDELAARVDGLRRQSLAGPQTTLLPPVR